MPSFRSRQRAGSLIGACCHLITMWLECPVEETDDRVAKTRTTEARTRGAAFPQGSPISPLLANFYMRRFVLGWKMLGLERSLGTRLVAYADDLVILCRRGKAGTALQRLPGDHGQAGADGEPGEDTHSQVPEGEFDFLGYTFGRMYGRRSTGQARIGYRPIEEHSARGRDDPGADRPIGNVARNHEAGRQMNRTLRGSANYFSVGAYGKAYRALTPTRRCGCAGGCARAQVEATQGGAYPLSHLYGHFGLVRLAVFGATIRGRRRQACPRPDAANLPVRFDEGV